MEIHLIEYSEASGDSTRRKHAYVVKKVKSFTFNKRLLKIRKYAYVF
jgi:hypothetical protein